MPARTLVIACGAVAREIAALVRHNGWGAIEVQCLPAIWHNVPERIPGGVREKIRAARARGDFGRIFVAYADCGTGGALDTVLEEEGVERLPGVHCYEFFAGAREFAALHDAEPGTLYLTDYLARNFDRLIIRGLGIDRHPELEPMYFGNYRRVVYLAQTEDEKLLGAARAAAARLGLAFEHRFTGYGGLRPFLERAENANRSMETKAFPLGTGVHRGREEETRVFPGARSRTEVRAPAWGGIATVPRAVAGGGAPPAP